MDASLLQLRATVLCAELERLRGIGMPLEHAAALLEKCLSVEAATPPWSPSARARTLPGRRARGTWRTA